jgi:hypothetical protein
MPEMLGNNFLPESVTSARRRFREQVMQMRRPVRRFRERNVPGPDIVGRVESELTSLRDNFVRRESVLSQINRRNMIGASGNSSPSNGGTADSPNSTSPEDHV